MTGAEYFAETVRMFEEAPMMAAKCQRFTDEIAELEALLADESIASARLDNIGGGRAAGELTATERGAARRVKMERRIIDLRHRIAAIERILDKMELETICLYPEEAVIIRERMKGTRWAQIARKLGRKSCSRATWERIIKGISQGTHWRWFLDGRARECAR